MQRLQPLHDSQLGSKLKNAKKNSTRTLDLLYAKKRLEKTANILEVIAFLKVAKMDTMQRLYSQFGSKIKDNKNPTSTLEFLYGNNGSKKTANIPEMRAF